MEFNFEEMFATLGGKLFYGGIGGAVIAVILLIILAPVFSFEKKKLIKKLDDEYDNKR